MRRIAKAALIGIGIVAAMAFFLAPISYWFSVGPAFAGDSWRTPIYRSLGCATLGLGSLYAPDWFGFSLGCEIPVPVPF